MKEENDSFIDFTESNIEKEYKSMDLNINYLKRSSLKVSMPSHYKNIQMINLYVWML